MFTLGNCHWILFLGRSAEPLSGRSNGCDPQHPLPDGTDASLFLSILKSYIKSTDRVTCVLCWERKTTKFLQSLDQEDCLKLRIIDCLVDFHGWINPEQRQTGLISIIKKTMDSENIKEINVVVDSLSNPLFTIGFGLCLEELQQMINSSINSGPKIHQLMCLVYGDLLPRGPSSINHLKHLASTVVELKQQVAHITHRKQGGRVERKEEKYSILSEFSIDFLHNTVLNTPSYTMRLVRDLENVTLPQDVATFRVGLSDKEKEDRDKLVLPYMRSNEESKNGGGGKVFYQPDAVDDWDDEDPDDDLDV